MIEPRWTDEEMAFLREVYPLEPKQQILKNLPNRTWASIINKCMRLSIRRCSSNTKALRYNLTDYEKGFLEGAIDAEGSIGLGKNHGSGYRYLKGFRWAPFVVVVNTETKFLDKIKGICGGGSIFNRYKKQHEGWKPCYVYQMNCTIMRIILPQISLVIKEEQRQLLLEALSLFIHGGSRRKELRGMKTLNDERLQQIYEEMRLLNKRGVE